MVLLAWYLFNIDDISIEIEALKAEHSEAIDQSKWVQEKLHEIEAQKSEAQNTIRTAERVLQMKTTSTRSEVFRLKGIYFLFSSFQYCSQFASAELEALEDLHMLRITKVNDNLFEYIYASTFLVSIPCADFHPIVNKVRIIRSGKGQTRYKDEFPKLSTFLLASANHLINEGEDLNVREVRIPLDMYFPQSHLADS
jgi:kinetochore protein Spc7/SPC105